jgi:hypothetical protein
VPPALAADVASMVEALVEAAPGPVAVVADQGARVAAGAGAGVLAAINASAVAAVGGGGAVDLSEPLRVHELMSTVTRAAAAAIATADGQSADTAPGTTPPAAPTPVPGPALAVSVVDVREGILATVVKGATASYGWQKQALALWALRLAARYGVRAQGMTLDEMLAQQAARQQAQQ